MADFSTLTVERAGRVATVTFRRGDQLNAMNRQMQGEIITAFETLSVDPGVGAIVVTGDGRAFMAGADIKEYAAQTGPEFDAFQENGGRMYAAIEDNAKPVIAAVNGFALGGGFEIVLCCDIVIAAKDAKMGLPEIKLGLVPGGGGTQRSVTKLGRNRANLLLMTGAIVPAGEFVAAGLVNELAEPQEVLPRALALAEMIAAEPAEAIEGLKHLTGLALEGDLTEGLRQERDLVNALYRSEIGQRRVQAFAARSAARAAEKARMAGGQV
jgi:enoyl-CoA hydratase/carnithine racemase